MNETEYETLTGHAPVEDDLERVNCVDETQEGHRHCGTCADCGKPRTQCAVDVNVTEWATEPWRPQLNALANDMEALAKRMRDIAGDAQSIRYVIDRKYYTQADMNLLKSLISHTQRATWTPYVYE